MKTNVRIGEFPYPLRRGEAEESRYLTWVRNHSNYMAERGFLDYMRIVAVLVRGIVVNFLTVLPFILAASVALSFAYGPLLDQWQAGELSLTQDIPGPTFMRWIQTVALTGAPYLLTPLVAAITVGWFLAFPLVIRLFKVITHRKAATGQESSVKLRDLYERSFGGLLVGILGFAIVESLPILIHYFHEFPWENLRGEIATVAGGSSVVALSGAGKVLSMLDDKKRSSVTKSLVTMAIGLLGILLPMIVVFYATEFIVYHPATEGVGLSTDVDLPWNLLLVVPITLGVGIVLAMGLGLIKRAFDHWLWLFGMLIGVGALVTALFFIDHWLPAQFQQPWLFVLGIAGEIWLFCWLAVDINLTSINGLYRDRLASAFLVGQDTKGDIDIEEDLDLYDICQHQNGSTAPYHIINVALNLQGSKDMSVRERNSDFFMFSKRFIGSNRTGYCTTGAMERVYPQMDLATAMAISAAAASPNMGTGTAPAQVALMTLFNIRLGYWVPHPGSVQLFDGRDKPYRFTEVFAEELGEIQRRWHTTYGPSPMRGLAATTHPSPRHGLLGLAFSGGGIRSATLNLGIVQALHERGVFDHVDYLSTVSGGGYLGSSISTLMRTKKPTADVSVDLRSQIDGNVRVETNDFGEHILTVTGEGQIRTHRYPRHRKLLVKNGESVNAGTPLVEYPSLYQRFRWRVRPRAFLREMASKIDERHPWINLSDGGHIENLAVIELLRRKCKYIIVGDGGADPTLRFGSLATLIRYARIDLGIEIDINVDEIRPDENGLSKRHWALGRIAYPGFPHESDFGYFLYLKSSFTGNEDPIVREYRQRKPAFPHESTSDQFFDENQFEAYRDLGCHIGEEALDVHPPRDRLGCDDLEEWFRQLAAQR